MTSLEVIVADELSILFEEENIKCDFCKDQEGKEEKHLKLKLHEGKENDFLIFCFVCYIDYLKTLYQKTKNDFLENIEKEN